MVKIIVMGSGLIPRGGGIAPRLNPFEADINLIRTTILTNGLQVYMINPDTGNKVRVNMQNYEKMYKAFDHAPVVNKVEKKETVQKEAILTKPPIIETVPEPKVETPKVEIKAEELKIENVHNEEHKEETPLVPVNNPNNNDNNDYRNNKHNNKK